jgi:hypothetical protein
MSDSQLDQEINSFKKIFVVKNFLTKTEIRKAEQLLEAGQWENAASNNTQGNNDKFCRWMPLLPEHTNQDKSADFQILEIIDTKIKDILNKYVIELPTVNSEFYIKNCGVFSLNTTRPYYADNAYPVDSNKEVVILGDPDIQGFDSITNLDKIKEWEIREWATELKYSCMLFLGDETEGGNLVFPEHETEVAPERNKLVIFPSTPDYIHGERPVLKGIKNCYCSWYASNNKDLI